MKLLIILKELQIKILCSLVVPTKYKGPAEIEWEDLKKHELFDALSAFPGRRIAILNCCHADYNPIPPNTLLVAASKNNETTSSGIFADKRLRDLASFRYEPKPLDDNVRYISTNDDVDYKREKELGKEILHGRQK